MVACDQDRLIVVQNKTSSLTKKLVLIERLMTEAANVTNTSALRTVSVHLLPAQLCSQGHCQKSWFGNYMKCWLTWRLQKKNILTVTVVLCRVE